MENYWNNIHLIIVSFWISFDIFTHEIVELCSIQCDLRIFSYKFIIYRIGTAAEPALLTFLRKSRLEWQKEDYTYY